MRLYKTQYSFRISGNRGYDSNRVRFSDGLLLHKHTDNNYWRSEKLISSRLELV